MNRIFRVVWNASIGMWQVRSELGGAYGKAGRSRTARRALSAASLSVLGAAACAADLPTGAAVVAGQGYIAQQGGIMTVNQTSAKLAIDWNSFSIGKGNTVNFIQPTSASVALNRVTGSDVSVIQGALKANGQVFLLNPNGVLFSPSAQVNVGGLLASTLNMTNQDFMSGDYKLQGASSNAVINQGNIKAFNGGSVALVAAHVSNAGEISAERGNVLLGAGSEVLVDLGGPIKLQVKRGAIDALVENGGAVFADGGNVLMTAKAAGDLVTTVINNSGLVQARTLASGAQGQIMLLGDMQNGRIDIAGKLDASAPQGGNGGFIETSAADVATTRNVQIDASAAHGQGGQWLIDPYNYTIDTNAANNIVGALNLGTSVTVTTQSSASSYGATASGSGDITVASAIAKSSGGDAMLTLRADRNIVVNSDITSTAGKLGVTLSAGNAASATVGGVDINANLKSNGGNILIGGANGTAVNGIGYALNSSASTAGVVVERAKSILSTGGNIVINGKSLVGSNSGNYSGTTGGVYIMSDATIQSGSGNLFITGVSSGGVKTFGVAFEGASGTLTTVGNSAGGGMLLNAINATPGNTQAVLDQGAIGMVSYGNRARIAFQGNSVASWLVFVNGAPQLSAYTQSPQLSSCASPYPNCGTLVIPGSNNSYLYATYQAVSMATQPIYVIQNANGSKTYDGNNIATGLTFSTLGGPAGFSVTALSPAVAYTTNSKNAGYYAGLNADPNNPTSYTSGGTSYAVGYFNTGSYTITPKALTPIAANKVYDGSTVAAVSATGVVAGDSVSLSGNGAFGSKDVGSYTVNINNIVLSGADAGNYTLANNSASATASITARQLTVTATKTYDGSADMSGYVSLGNMVADESLNYTGAQANSPNVGSASYISAITLQDGSSGLASNYALPGLTSASAANTASITPKTLTLTGLAASNKTYDGNATATLNGGTLIGLVGTETLTVSGMSGAFADKNAGTGKSVTVSGIVLSNGTGLASNYSISNPTGLTATITPRATTVSGITAADKTYDGTTSAQLNTGNAAFSNLVDGDSLNISATGAFTNANAGSGKTVNITSTYGGADAANYTITDQASATASIARKALVLTGLSASDKTYDGNTSATLNGGTLTGLVGTETLTVSGMSGAFVDKNAGAGKSVTVSGIILSDGTGLASNYSISNPAGLTATIAPRAATVSGITAADKTYDGTTAAQLNTGNAAFSNLVDGDSLNISATGAFTNANAGSGKTVNITSTYGGADAGNYTITDQASATASIARKALVVTGLSASDKTYDGNTSATLNGGTLSGLVGAESLTVSGMSGAFADKNAGAGKSVTVSGIILSDGTGLSSNYSISNPAGLTATIAPRATTVSGITAADKIYDGTTTAQLNTGNAAFSNLVDGDSLNISATGAFANANAGSGKTVNIISTYGGADAANYTITDQASTTASIARKALAIVGMTANDKTYDASTAASVTGGSLSGLVGTDTLTFSGQTATFADRHAGNNKTVSVAGIVLADGTGFASNYELVMPSGLSASILPKALTISGLAASNKVEDGSTAATLTAHGALAGVEAGDGVHIDGSAATAQFAQSTPGTGIAVSVSGLALAGADAHNYSISGGATTTASITAIPAPAPVPVPTPAVIPVQASVPAPQPAPVQVPESIPEPVTTPMPAPTPVSVPPLPTVQVPVPTPVPVTAPAPVPTPAVAPAPAVVQVPLDAPAPVPATTPQPAPVQAVVPTLPQLAAPIVIPAPEPTLAPVPTPIAETTPAPVATPAAVPAPAPVAQPSPAADTKAAISAQVASPTLQGGVTPAMPSLSVGGLNYTDVSESSSGPASSNSRENMPATQSLTAGRDVKFLSVFVVSGGIQMPAAATSSTNASTSDQK